MLKDVPPLLIFLIAHLVEFFLLVRFYILSVLLAPFSVKPRSCPSWIGQLLLLQPATLEYMSDALINDSRARNVLGYENRFTQYEPVDLMMNIDISPFGVHHK